MTEDRQESRHRHTRLSVVCPLSSVIRKRSRRSPGGSRCGKASIIQWRIVRAPILVVTTMGALV